jgi:hypothetical protein
MRTRYRVDGRKVRLEASDGSASVVLEVSRTGSGQGSADGPGSSRSSGARAVCVGKGRSLSWSRARSEAAGRTEVQAEVAGNRRHRFKLSE